MTNKLKGKGNGRYSHGHCTNGYSNTYYVWSAMIQRCTNQNNKQYAQYGGSGVNVCNRWLKFDNFINDMGEPEKGETIDRINNNKGYSKENCRWVTNQENCQNRSNNILNAHLVREIRRLNKTGMKTRHIANKLGVKEGPCYAVVAGTTWGNIE